MIQCFWLEETGEEIREESEHGACWYRPLRRTDTGEVYKHFQAAPPGAMMDCDYLKEFALPEAEAKALPDFRFRIRKHPDQKRVKPRPSGRGRIAQRREAC